MAGEPPDLIRMDSDRSIDWNLEDYSCQDNSSNKVSWAFKSSCSVGKKILVTGFVLSSAPVVLPPLVVISALGFAVSIPYGVFLASYACTEKIMSILLPNPSPPLLEYQSETNEAMYSDEEFGDYKDYTEQNYVQGSAGDKEKEFEHSVEMVAEIGYEEDFDESMEEEDEASAKGIISGNSIIAIKNGEGDEPMIEKRKNDELLDDLHVDVIVVQGDEDNKLDAESREMPLEATTVVFEENGSRERVSDIRDEEELSKETRGLLEEIKDEGNADSEGVEVIQELEVVMEDDKSTGEKGNSTSTSAENTLGPGAGDQIREPSDAVVGNEQRDNQKGAQSENLIHDEKKDDSRIRNIDSFQLHKEKRMLVNSLQDGREISDESGFDLLDKAKSAAHYPLAGHETSEGYSHSKDDETVDFPQLPVSGKPAKSEEVGLSSLIVIDVMESADLSVSAVTVESKVEANATDKDGAVPSNEGSYSEEKIREQINSVKKIVGYKGAPHESCTEELNALYTFVGVEPPSSLRDPSDLNEVNEKLQFLKSVVGVK